VDGSKVAAITLEDLGEILDRVGADGLLRDHLLRQTGGESARGQQPTVRTGLDTPPEDDAQLRVIVTEGRD